MQDYKHVRYNLEKAPKKRGRKLLAILILLMIAITPLAYSYYQNGTLLLKSDANKPTSKIEEPVVEINIPDRFTYFQILAKGEAIIQDKDIPKVDVPSNKIYIQLAAFKTADEADNFEAQLKLLELKPKVDTLFIPNKGGTWFTVRLGPVETDDELARLKLALDSNQIKFAVVTKQ